MKTDQIKRATNTAPNIHRLTMQGGLVALALTLYCPGLLAEEQSHTGRLNISSSSGSRIQWMSGGIGEEAREAMRQAARNYNVHITFSTRDGAYLASIPFAVSDETGQIIITGISEGPLLNLKLKPGAYQITAEINHSSQSKRLRIGSALAPTKLNFVGASQ